MDDFDPERFKLPPGAVGKAKPSKRLPRHKRGERFLWGPLPLSWFATAGNLPGRALHVGLVLWWLSGVKKDRTVKWESTAAEPWGLNRWAAHRGLAALELAGLVAIERHPGRSPVVTINDVPGD
ncbi:MAG: hypothetical protein ACREHD_09260 [Pirellulales bacterium]